MLKAVQGKIPDHDLALIIVKGAKKLPLCHCWTNKKSIVQRSLYKFLRKYFEKNKFYRDKKTTIFGD